MSWLPVQTIFFVSLLFLAGCANYKVPLQTENHPASSHTHVSQIELSSILDVPQETTIEKQETHVHHH